MKFTQVNTLEDAYGTLAEHGPDTTLLAGGTDVMVQYQAGLTQPKHLVHLHAVDELLTLDAPGGAGVDIGALTTHHRIATDPTCRTRLPALATASSTVGGWQTQTAGTIGGNLCNASPAADTPPALLVADAVVHVGSVRGTRSVPLGEFIRGRRDLDLAPDELVIGVTAEPIPTSAREAYLKVGVRSAMEVALVGLAMRLTVIDDVVTAAAIAATAVGPRPFRATAAEAALVGADVHHSAGVLQLADAERLRAAGDALADAASPIDDARATASYRRAVLPRLLGRVVQQCLAAFDRDPEAAPEQERTER